MHKNISIQDKTGIERAACIEARLAQKGLFASSCNEPRITTAMIAMTTSNSISVNEPNSLRMIHRMTMLLP